MTEKKTNKPKKGEIKLFHDESMFSNVDARIDYGDEPVSDTKQKLEIFDVLARLDARDGDFFSTLTPDLQKQFAPLVVMRWMSAIPDSSEYSEYTIGMINEIVNVDFWALYKHPELQWRLLALCGIGKKQRHQWIPMAQRKKASNLGEYILRWLPLASDLEIETIIRTTTEDEFGQFVRQSGVTEAEETQINELFKIEKAKLG